MLDVFLIKNENVFVNKLHSHKNKKFDNNAFFKYCVTFNLK